VTDTIKQGTLTGQAAVAGTALPDGTACDPALDPNDPAMLALTAAVDTATADDQPSAGLLDGSSKLNDTSTGHAWYLPRVTDLADTLDQDTTTLTSAIGAVATACTDQANLAAATTGWADALTASEQPLSDAQGVLDASEGQVTDENTRQALTEALEAAQAAQAFNPEEQSTEQITAATTTLTDAVAALTPASQAVTESHAAWEQAQAEAAAQASEPAGHQGGTTTSTSTSNGTNTKPTGTSGTGKPANTGGTTSKPTGTTGSSSGGGSSKPANTGGTASTGTTPANPAPAPAPEPAKPAPAPAKPAPAPKPAKPAPKAACYTVVGSRNFPENYALSIVLQITDKDKQGWKVTVTGSSGGSLSDTGKGSYSPAYSLHTKGGDETFTVSGLPRC
jgi:hypothetical protein